MTDKDREFWSFRPPGPVSIPAVRHPEQVRNPIDAFVLEKLEAKGLTLSPEADRLDAAAAGLVRPDRAAAGARRDRRLPRRPRPERLRETGRPPARLAALRRTLGPALARRGRLRRLRRQARAGPAAAVRLALSRLRHPLVQRRQAVRPLPARTDRRRRAGRLRACAGDHAGDRRQPRRHRLPAHGPRRDLGQHHELRPRPARRDRRRDRRPRLGRAGPDDQVRPLPHPQVRPDPAARLLPAGRRSSRARSTNTTGSAPTGSPPSARASAPTASCPTSRPPSGNAGRRTTRPSSARSKRSRRGPTPKSKEAIAGLQKQILPEPTIRALWDRGEPSPTYLYRRGDYLSPGRSSDRACPPC